MDRHGPDLHTFPEVLEEDGADTENFSKVIRVYEILWNFNWFASRIVRSKRFFSNLLKSIKLRIIVLILYNKYIYIYIVCAINNLCNQVSQVSIFDIVQGIKRLTLVRIDITYRIYFSITPPP